MGFWNKLGRGLLKVAPIAAAFIPGVGPLASMAIGAGTSALEKKMSGGSWMDALKSGAIGGATGWAGAKLPTGGLGPSKGFWGTTGDVLKKTGKSMLGRGFDLGGVGGTGNTGYAGGLGRNGRSSGGGWQDMLGDVLNRGGEGRYGGGREGRQGYGRGEEGGGFGEAVERGGRGMSSFGRRMQRQLGPVMGQMDQSNPNLAMSLGAGRMDAMRNQPWRGGYDVISQGPEPADDSQGNVGPEIRDSMPPIYPNSQRRQQRYY